MYVRKRQPQKVLYLGNIQAVGIALGCNDGRRGMCAN
jgi:hypothetical protein